MNMRTEYGLINRTAECLFIEMWFKPDKYALLAFYDSGAIIFLVRENGKKFVSEVSIDALRTSVNKIIERRSYETL